MEVSPIKVKRNNDKETSTSQGKGILKEYEVEVKQRNQEYTSILTIDEKNHIVTREDQKKMGVQIYKLK